MPNTFPITTNEAAKLHLDAASAKFDAGRRRALDAATQQQAADARRQEREAAVRHEIAASEGQPLRLVKFKDEDEAESWSWLFEHLNWRLCCAGGYYNAWCPREDRSDKIEP
jgi:hypothetical protein